MEKEVQNLKTNDDPLVCNYLIFKKSLSGEPYKDDCLRRFKSKSAKTKHVNEHKKKGEIV
jgi:hypothetical protein